METVVIIGGLLAFAAYWYWPKKAVSTLVPVAKSVKASEAPRWHRYDVLLELQVCLRKHGADEKAVSEICEKAAQLLLGDEK